MEIEAIRKLIKDKVQSSEVSERNSRIETAEQYYRNKNDIKNRKLESVKKKEKLDAVTPLRNADNRVSHAWHRLLVNQKASYAMAEPPQFDVNISEHVEADEQKELEAMNDTIVNILGDSYPKTAKDLCVNASNAGISWLHVWIDEETGDFEYAVIDTKQIVPIYSKKLNGRLHGLFRTYEDINDEGETIVFYEYWNDKEVSVYSKKQEQGASIEEAPMFTIRDISTNEAVGDSNRYTHGWDSGIPFIPFRNSSDELSDLELVKDLIDVYDKVYSGFVNDIDDVQEIIFVLTNYGGEDKNEFLSDLNNYKVVKVDSDEDGEGAVETLAIDIPTEAREKLLEITRESIFVNGQGVDPQRNIGQNNSGVALKFMYSLLELKASSLETEFKEGFATLVRFILEFSNLPIDLTVSQTWKRTAINNDVEEAEIVSQLAPVTSKENTAKANPIVDDWQNEIHLLESEDYKEFTAQNDYRPNEDDEDDVDGQEEE